MTTYKIVGAHYRPPAKALIAGISQGTILTLRAEPTNPFDENAIQVLLKRENINESDHENLNSELSGFGKDIDDILSQPEWHLGYIPREIAKVLRESQIINLNTEYPCEFIINFSGIPMISLDT